MGKLWVVWLALSATWVAVGAGCSSAPPWGRSAGASRPPAIGLDVNRPAGPLAKLTSSVTGSSVGQSVAGAFKRTTEKASQWIQPPASEPQDPISLFAQTKPPDADFYVALAQLQEQSNNIPAARKLYQKALQYDHNHLGALLGTAHLHDREGELAKAAELYQDAVRRHPREARAYNDLGLCYARQRLLEPSAGALSRAIELEPDRALYRNNIATVLVEMGQSDEALEHLAAVHGQPIAHYNLGFLLAERGQSQAALVHFAMAADENPSFHAAHQWVATLRSQMDSSDPATPAVLVADRPPAPESDGSALAPGSDPAPESISAGIPDRTPSPTEPAQPQPWPVNNLGDGPAPATGPAETESDRQVRPQPLPPVDREHDPAEWH